MSGKELTTVINLLAEYAAANLPADYEVVLVLRSDEWWLELQHDDDGDIAVRFRATLGEVFETAREYEKERRGES